MTPGQVLNELQERLAPGDFSNSLAYLTLDRMRAMQHKYWRKNRLCGKDVDAVRKMIHAPDFPLLSCSKELRKGLSETSADTAQAPLLQGFHILICSDAQSLMLKKFGDLVFLDTVHGTTKYSYFNLTILVLDEFGQGFPVAFMLSQTETSNDWNFLIKSVFQVCLYSIICHICPNKTNFAFPAESWEGPFRDNIYDRQEHYNQSSD